MVASAKSWKLLPPDQLVAPTTPLLLTAACMVRNLHPPEGRAAVADESSSGGGHREIQADGEDEACSESTVGGSSFGPDGVRLVVGLRDTCVRRAALAPRYASQLAELEQRLHAAAAARHVTQLHAHALAATLCRLHALSRLWTLESLCTSGDWTAAVGRDGSAPPRIA